MSSHPPTGSGRPGPSPSAPPVDPPAPRWRGRGRGSVLRLSVLLLVLLVFVAAPVALGYAIGDVVIARMAWVALGAIMALSQAQDPELGGMWVVVVAVVLIGLLLVQLGHRLRRRRS